MATAITKHVGRGLKRVEDPRYLTGRGQYLDDLCLPDLLHARFLRSPHARARIRGMETIRAREAPGVVGVWTGADLAGAIKPIGVDDAPLPGFRHTPWPALAIDTLRFVGEPVAVVVATDRYAAEDATELIEVDRDTGEVRFLRYAAVHDCGRIINPKLLAAQVHGAIAQGLGPALGEVMWYSPEGQPLTGSFLDYSIPVADDIPAMSLDFRETPSPTNPLGVKGIRELPTVAAPVAIANAVLDALSGIGVRHIDIPLTAEKIWHTLQQAGGTAAGTDKHL